jgi:SAM-dependent methyltransferase
MKQDAIWDHYQNEGVASFHEASARLHYVARHLAPAERVLNIGIGSGELEQILTARGVEVWSLDPSERAVAKLADRTGYPDRCMVGYSQDMAYPDDHFDAVVMSEVLEHLDPSVFEKTLSEVSRVLRPGGRLIGTVPASEQLETSMVVCPNCQAHFHRWGHQRSFDAAGLSKALEGSFKVERVEERFFSEWEGASWKRRMAGIVKRWLSDRRIGPYGVARNLFFIARASGAVSRPVGAH